MTRNYPFNLINNDNTVDIKTATSIAIKFLIKNNCLKDYVRAWLNHHKESWTIKSQKTAKHVVGRTIEILYERQCHLTEFFSSVTASFGWFEAQEKLGQDSRKWQKISHKWRREVGYDVRIIK